MSRLVAERGGYDLMPELGYKPVNKYLPPRERTRHRELAEPAIESVANPLLRWIDRALSR